MLRAVSDGKPVAPRRTFQGPWLKATAGGGSWTGVAPTLQPGVHILYAFASDAQMAGSVNTGSQSSPLIGRIQAYVFLVINGNTKPVYRFRNKALGVHFYAVAQAEVKNLRDNLSAYWAEEPIAYHVPNAATQVAGTRPVYRFRNRALGVHFYAVNPVEAQNVRDKLWAYWAEEPVAYYVPE